MRSLPTSGLRVSLPDMSDEPIIFKAHNPDWAKVFNQQAALLKTELGEYIAAIHHVGSTAIPYITAKPIIDIAIESSVYPPSDFVVQTLTELEFEAHGSSGVAGRNWFSKGVPRAFNLHWCPKNGTVVQSMVCFRDALQADTTLARQYEALKKKASYGMHIDSAEYAAAKDKFVEKVLSR